MTVVTTAILLVESRASPPGRTGETPVTPRAALAVACLKAFDQVADAQRVGFAMAVTGDRIGASGRFNQNVGPKNSRRNFHRSYLGNRNAFLVAAKQTPLHAAHTQRADHDARREPQVPPGPAARGEGLIGSNGP